MKQEKVTMKHITLVVVCFVFFMGICKAQKPQDFKFSPILCDTLNNLQVGINFEPTRYRAGFNYINEDGYKVTLLRYIHVYTQFGINIYRWQANMRLKNGTEIIFYTDDYWLDINNGIANNRVFYDSKKNRIVYPPELKNRRKNKADSRMR